MSRVRVAWAVVVVGLIGGHAASASVPTSFEFLGAAEIEGDPQVDGLPAGGFSGIVWDEDAGSYLVISDDRSERGPARFHRIAIDLEGGRLTSTGARLLGSTILRDGRSALPKRSLDPEGIAISRAGLYISSEGEAKQSIPPFVALFERDGKKLREMPLPERYLPDGRTRGVRDNLGFEALTLSPDERFLFAGTENALAQEGVAAAPGVPSLSRILRWDLERGGMPEEFLYRVEGINVTPPAANDFMVNGLVSLLALDGERLLALERQWVPGIGLSVRLYAISLTGLPEVSRIDPPRTFDLASAPKTLLFDFAELGTRLDNFEGMTFGPALADGRRSFFVVSDDNFAPDIQRSLFLGFAVGFEPIAISALQGAGHRSPYEGRWVAGIEGAVTAVERGPRSRGFWLEAEHPDSDPATSEAIHVDWEGASTLSPGMRVLVGGRIEERAAARNLSVTTLRLVALAPIEGAAGLPLPPRLERDRFVPGGVDDDAMREFEVEKDARDFWESLESMRVEVPAGTVVGPTRSFGELVILPDGSPSRRLSARGGPMIEPDDEALGRVIVGRRLAGAMPDLAVGDRVREAFVGIVDYGFSNYKVQPLVPLVTGQVSACGASTRLRAERGKVTLATLNVENVSIATGADRMPAFGSAIVRELGAPAIVALEEVQDDSGRADDGVVTSRATLDALAAAIIAAGGPHYEATWIDPENNRDGGQPSGNIRVVLLYDPARAALVRRGEGGARDATRVEGRGSKARLTLSPGRVAPESQAFEPTSGEGVRKPLAAEFRVGRETLFVVANHLSSKWDDDRLFGGRQPPVRRTGERRLAQAIELRTFAESLLAARPKANLVILGDLNEPEWGEAVKTLARPPLTNLTTTLEEGERYTFNFEGISQAIDHVIVSPSLAPAAEIDIVHRNSDCPDSLRISDHDPVVVRLKLP